jgi:mRNA-degrading endonuclease toxin of MazEF toxin-antitoxin module
MNGKLNMIALDQIRAIDRSRISNYIDKLKDQSIKELKELINEMLVK